MDCIPYVNDLMNEISILNNISKKDAEINNLILKKQKEVDKIKNILSKMSVNSIEYRLYLKILNGQTPTKAVSEIANENYMSDKKPTGTTQIWKYYKKIKKYCKSVVKV